MLSTSLSKRQDLVEGLDADAIVDYLTHHGVLDPAILIDLEGGGEVTAAQRNSAILQHVEEHGDTAVALFINALRQSGQLHLASSLDTEQRIKPASGNSNTYFGKSRHKGEICVRLEIEALKILAPREPTERNVNLSLLSSPSHDAPTVLIDDEDDQVKPKSCWCFCLSRKRKSSRSSSKKGRRKNKYKDTQQNDDIAAGEIGDSSHPPSQTCLPSGGLDHGDPNMTPHRTKSMDRGNNRITTTSDANGSSVSTSFLSSLPSTPHHSYPAKTATDKKKMKQSSKHKFSGKPDVPATIQESDTLHTTDTLHTMPEVAFRSGACDSTKKSVHKASMPKDLPLTTVGENSDARSKTGIGKENSDGIIMEYDAQLELVKLRAGHDELASPTRQAGPVGILVEQWKCSGKHFLAKSEVLCDAIVDEFHTDIIKYFEQDRGTLVLDVVSEGTAVVVFNICMTKMQVERLEKDHANGNGNLLERLQELFTSKVDISKFDIRGVQYRTVVDDIQLKSVLSELS